MKKNGLSGTKATDSVLLSELFKLLEKNQLDYTLFFRALSHFDSTPGAGNHQHRDLFIKQSAFGLWVEQYRQRLQIELSVDCERHPVC